MLVVAGYPSYFNNYQPSLQHKQFLRQQMKHIAAGCIFVPQAVQCKHNIFQVWFKPG
jgi:hypothetical protein